jgi:anti-anti-sigma regulatory factor
MTVTGFDSSAPRDGGVWVITLGEDAGLQAATELHTELEDAVSLGARRVVVELAGASPVDSTVLGVLLAGLRRLDRAGAELVIVAARGLHTGSAVDSLRLDRFFRIEPTLREALSAFEQAGRPRRPIGLRT